MAYLITVDVGTSSTKTALWDETGRIAAEAQASYSLRRLDPLSAEIDAPVWWAAVCSTIKQVVSGIDPPEIAGIGVDGVGWTLLAVDKNNDPLTPALIWLDRRADAEAKFLNDLPEAASLIALSANPLDPAYITPKLLWLKKHDPAVFDQTHTFLTASGYITACLTGEFTCDFTQAYGYHFFDIARERWDENAAALLDIPLEKMPRLCPCTEIVGTVTAKAAAATGLPVGVPVIAGCLDAASGALGAGVTRPGQTNEQGGQAGGMAVSLKHVVVEPRLIFSHHVLPGQYLLQAGTVGGGMLGWFRDVLGQVESSAAALIGTTPFDLFSQQAAASPPGAHGLIFLPYMAGERTPLWSSTARGVFFGLSYKTNRADLLRAIMEGCAYAVYDNVAIAAENGAVASEYLGSGGATQSAVWCQIKADIYGQPMVVARQADGSEGGHSLGLLALTASAVGWCDDAGAYVEHLLPERQVFEPSLKNHAVYADLFEIYRRISRRSLEDFDLLAAVARKHGL